MTQDSRRDQAAGPVPVGTSPVFSAPDPSQPSGAEPQRLGGSWEYLRGHDRSTPLSHDAYHALVREHMADLDRLDPGRNHLVADPRLIVALDVDGTILDMDGRVSERMMASIARMRHYGAQVVISTGRGIQEALPVARHVGLTDGWMICANGALTVRMDPTAPGGYRVVDSVTFDPTAAINALTQAVPDGILAVEDLDAGFRTTRAFPEGELIEEQTLATLDELCARPVTRVILRAPGMPLEEFSALVADSGLHSVEYAIGWTAWLDVAPEGVTKASALQRLAERLGTDSSHAVAVGDGTNDVEMLTWAGAGVAMGSAPQSVTAVASFTTEPVWRDGCAGVLDAVVERKRATC